MERQVVTDPGLPPTIGPYSHAVRAGGFVFVSGQPGLDPQTGQVPGNSFADEARQAFANLAAAFPVDPPTRMTMQVPLPRGLRISIGCAAVENA